MNPLLILLILAAFPGYGQFMEGIVRDSKTRTPLPYVHIGVPGKNLGTISAENGRFTIDITHADQSDAIWASMIGYETAKFTVGSLKGSKMEILLEPKIYELEAVTVKSRKTVITKLGRTKPSSWTTGQSGQKEFGFGAERGLQVLVPKGKKFRVLDARFHLRFNSVDSILFRVNVYSLKNGLPDESLLKKDAFIKSRKNDHWIICDLENQQLVLHQNVAITYEIVRWWFNQGDNEIFMTHGKDYPEGGIYYRLSSQDQWKTDSGSASFPVTMYLSTEEIIE